MWHVITVPLTCLCGVAVLAPSAGRNTTRIFLSSTAPLAMFSTFCHYHGQQRIFNLKMWCIYNGCNAAKVTFWRDSDGLYKKFVATFCIQRRILFHCLKENCMEWSAPSRRYSDICTDLGLQLRCHSRSVRNWAVHSSCLRLARNKADIGDTHCLGAVVLTCTIITLETLRLI